MMFTSISHKDDSSHKSGKSHCRKVKIEHVAPTKEDIQKKFDEQSFRHHISEQWADVKRKAFFVPSVIVKSVTSGEEPFMITKEETFKVTFLQRVFLLFDQPEHCFLGEIISFITMLVIIISCIGYIASAGSRVVPHSCDNPACENDPDLCPDSMICPPEESANYELIETICIAFFTIDYFIRLFLVALMPARLAGILPSYFDTLNANAIMPCPVYSGPITVWRYMKIPMNIIDLIAILPFYVAYFSTSGSSVSIIRILRLVRVLRVFKIGGMGNGITLMSNAMMNSLSAMGILLFFTVLGVILFGSIIFFLEAGTFIVNEDFPEGAYLRWDVLGIAREESPFSSILVSCYWAMVTFTTVGYGDLVPTSPFGRFISLVLMYTGILVLALPISVIGANFQREYERLEGGDEDEEDNDDDDEDQPTARAPVKRGLMRSSSSSGSLTMSKRELQAAERLVKKTLQRERSKSNASAMGEEALAEAMLPVTEQLARLSFTCGKMMERIEVLQKQQNEMMLHISPSSKFEANMGMKEKKEDEEDEENSGRRDCLPPREDGIELGRVEGGAGPVGGERDERGYSRSSSEISTTNSTVGLVLNHNNSSSSY